MEHIRTLALPVAGLGKRLYPLTRFTPKNLLRVNGRPLLEYELEEAIRSGIRRVVLIANPKSVDRFRAYVRKNKGRYSSIKFTIRVQERPGGNGHALLSAFDILRKESFAVRFCDDILIDETPVLGSLIKLSEFYRAPAILLERVPARLVSRFGVVGIRKVHRFPQSRAGHIYEITSVIEKPPLRLAPSNLTVVGGYVLTPRVLMNLKRVADSLPAVANDAIPINVGFQIELIVGGKIYGWEFPGTRLDCGTLDALQHAERVLKSAYRNDREQ